MNAPERIPAGGTSTLTLGIAGFTYADLYEPQALARLCAAFDADLAMRDGALAERFAAYRACRGEGMTPEDISAVLTDTAPHLGQFIARLFRIEDAWQAQQQMIRDEDGTILGFRNAFIAPLLAN